MSVRARLGKAVLAAVLALLAAACGSRGPYRVTRVAEGAPLPRNLVEALDLQQRLGEALIRRPDEAVRFDGPKDERLLVSGWGSLEVDPGRNRGFAWAVGSTAEVALHVIPADAMELSFTCRPLAFPGAPPQEVTVTLGGDLLGRVTLAEGLYTYRLPVPAALREGGRPLRFHFAWAEQPAQRVPGSTDTRRLAAAFYAVELEAPGETPSPAPAKREDGFVQWRRTEVAFRFRVPPGGMVGLGAAAPPGGATDDVTGEVWLRRADQTTERVALLPLRRARGRRWRVDLAPLAGETVELALRVATPTPGGAVWWRRPRLCADAERVDVRSNLVLVVIDTLRADHLSCYGGATRTPAMDALAASGVRFARAYSHIPITLPSHSTMFTSQLPREHGVHNNGDVLAPTKLTLAEVLRDNYRTTAGFVSLGVLSASYGIAQGFETYDDHFAEDWWKDAAAVNREVFRWLDGRPPEPFFLWVHYSDPHEPYAPPGEHYPEVRARLGGRDQGSFHADGHMVDLELALAPGESRLTLLPAGSRRSRRPLSFRYVSVDPPEITLAPGVGWATGTVNPRNPALLARPPVSVTLRNPGAYRTTAHLRFVCEEKQTVAEKRAAYAREVEYADRQLGLLMDRLRAGGWLDHTLVVLTADHGEGLGDHVQMAHVDQLYEAQMHVPLILSFPGRLPAGKVLTDVVSHLDLLPTIDDLLRLADPGVRRGRDLVPLMTGGAAPPPARLLLETFRPEAAVDRQALLEGDEKYILSLPAGREELYDLAGDPGERVNLVGERRDRADAMARALEALIEAADEQRGAPRPERRLSDEERQRLKTLGYL